MSGDRMTEGQAFSHNFPSKFLPLHGQAPKLLTDL